MLLPLLNKEKILVLLDFDLYSPNTILRGAQLAKAFNSTFEVLFMVESDGDGFDQPEKELMIAESKKLSKDLGASEFRIKEIRNVTMFFNFLEDFTRKMGFTQLVLAHVAESRWEEMIHGSLANYLMKSMSFIELHFISQDNAFPYEKWPYNKGIYAFLEPIGENDKYYLTEQKTKNTVVEGVFFKESATDFDYGVFLSFTEDKLFNSYKVRDSVATLVNKQVKLDEI
ncbi:hypothetical protein [Salicibibacter kimchii]|uniref:Universal stress protein UspA n=1 Tax=Salicibibacter kimchii TaxID=2099786 RepID=A0A345BXY9_9BACI|nr:hypothetical protein [Salicibibacter kimchii]AXF55820.1 hypothetical protein DT065_07115 [Salicibibacter kimchii]